MPAVFLLWAAWGGTAGAGPPFLTDDPEPVPYKHAEFYAFSTLDAAGGERDVQGPAFEFNVGALPNLQIHVVAPYALVSGPGAPDAHGLSDVELGLKVRFVGETPRRPQIGIFPMAELPTGDSDRGLGNGQTWFKLPVWIQKSWGPWTSYGGAGYAVNNAPGARSYPFGGWLLQRGFRDRLTLGGEVFTQGSDAEDGRAFGLLNVGGFYAFSPGFLLLFSGGHTVAGERHGMAYVGLYWTWGLFGGRHAAASP